MHRKPNARWLAVAIAVACAVAGCAQVARDAAPGRPLPGTPTFSQGVVSVANPHAAEAGAQVLEQGGNAVDAAVAIAYALNVVEPQSAGIGGGGFMLVHLAASGQTLAIDSRETAPAAATREMFVGVSDPSLQGLAVGVPGMVRGTELALTNWGRMRLSQVLQPAIRLASEGFAVTPRYAAVSCDPRSSNSPEAAAFFCPGGVAPVVGRRVVNAPLAQTLRLIAAHGGDCFYLHLPEKGCDIALGILEGQRFKRPPAGQAGRMTLDDLARYQPVLRQPVEGRYRGYTIKTIDSPSSGGLALLQMLQMLERFELGDAGQGFGFGAPNTAQVMADAMRIAFADRAVWMGDADFVPVPARGLLHPAYLRTRGAAIMPGIRLAPDPLPGDPRPLQTAGTPPAERLVVAEPVNGPGETTTHFSVVDRWGNLVSYTNTIESSHGIGVFAGFRRADGTFRSHGFLLNNELTDFNLLPSTQPFTGANGFNDVQPGKRPRSSMTPTILFAPDGKPLVAYGSPGGATIINTVLNVTLNLVDHRMGLQQAVDAPRLSVTSANGPVAVETALPPATVQALQAMGYTVLPPADFGAAQAVAVDPRNGAMVGAADPRRDGTVIGLPRR